MCKARKQIQGELQVVSIEVWQERPFTAVKVIADHNGGIYDAVGFSKVCWPDWWLPHLGAQIAQGRAEAAIARRIHKEQRRAEHQKRIADFERKTRRRDPSAIMLTV